MSKSFPSNMRAIVRPFGRFFVLCPSTNIDASFLCAQNSSDAASSNGRTTFFFENEIANGRLSAIFTSQRKKKKKMFNPYIIVGTQTTNQIFHSTIDNFTGARTTDKNDRTRVLDFLRFTSFQGPFGSRIFGLADYGFGVSFPQCRNEDCDTHYAKHGGV